MNRSVSEREIANAVLVTASRSKKPSLRRLGRAPRRYLINKKTLAREQKHPSLIVSGGNIDMNLILAPSFETV